MSFSSRITATFFVSLGLLLPMTASAETPPIPTPKPGSEKKVIQQEPTDKTERRQVSVPKPKPGRRVVTKKFVAVPKFLKLGEKIVLLPRVKPSSFKTAVLKQTQKASTGTRASEIYRNSDAKPKPKISQSKPKKKQTRQVASLSTKPKILTKPPALIDPAHCQRELARYRVNYSIVNPIRNEQGCNLDQGVRITRIGAVKIKSPVIVNCNTAIKFANWVENSVQRRANAILKSPVSTLHQYSGYSCRFRSKGKVSEHGYGNAIDIGRVTLKDGRVVSIDKDWDGEWQDHSSFLKAITHDACDIFKLVLTPYSNKDHHDHLHFDLGKWKKCEATREAAAN